jgi:formylglycine-generating enzyme
MRTFLKIVGVLCLASLTAIPAQAVTVDLVPVGNPDNAADPAAGILYGSVGYGYQIGKYEVTAGQYCEFLNAVARSADPYGLWNENMSSSTPISREWNVDHYVYAVSPGNCASLSVNYVSWGDAARFCNWLANGQPNTGVEDLTTTEDGSYYINGANTWFALFGINRKAGATWVLPSTDEWYKAAYYDPNKPGGPGYWLYPTGTDSTPSDILTDPDPGNSANFRDGDAYTVGPTYYRTDVGQFENSPSPYGTFDQAGNVFEWSESAAHASHCTLRVLGGSYSSPSDFLASSRIGQEEFATTVFPDLGFRVAYVPEPNAIVLALSGAVISTVIRRG